jgi:hypothetical protein
MLGARLCAGSGRGHFFGMLESPRPDAHCPDRERGALEELLHAMPVFGLDAAAFNRLGIE